MTTFGEIVTKVLNRLSLVEGLDAQIYAEPRIQLAVQHKFDTLFREYWWPEYTTYQDEYVLDGSTGNITGDLTDKLVDWRDLHSVLSEGSSKPLGILPLNTRITDIQAPTIVWTVSNPSKMFYIAPTTTTGKVWLTYRTKPKDFEEDHEVVLLDQQLMILGTCWDILEDDGTNPGASDKFRGLYQDQIAQSTRMFHNIRLDTVMPNRSVSSRWW
jgi:hypothetical protein